MKDVKILCVDDEKNVLENYKIIFKEYDITTESDPFQALQLIKKNQYDLFLIDYHMRGLNGIQLLTEIQKIYKTTYKKARYSTFLCTACGTTYLFKNERKSGIFHHFGIKPFKYPVLKEDVMRAIIKLLSERNKDKD